MLLQRNRFDVGIKKLRRRRRFMYPAGIALFFLFAVGVMIVLYPKGLAKRAMDMDSYDVFAIKYFENFHRADPKNIDVTLALAKMAISKNEFSKAQTLLRPLIEHIPPTHKKQTCLMICELYGPLLNAEKQKRGYVNLTWQKNAVKAGKTLLEVADTQDDFEKSALCLMAADDWTGVTGVITSEKLEDVGRLVKIATLSLGARKYVVSSQAYFGAMKKEHDKEKAKKLFWNGVDVLQASANAPRALEAANLYRHEFEFTKDDMLKYAKLSLYAGQPANAQSIMLDLLGGKF